MHVAHSPRKKDIGLADSLTALEENDMYCYFWQTALAAI